MELLVCIHGFSSDDPALDAQIVKPGDVICYHQDGADWGLAEVQNPNWRIVSVPGLTVAEAEALIAPELPVDPANQSPLLQARHMRIDLAALVARVGAGAIANALANRAAKAGLTTAAQVRAAAIDATVPLAAIRAVMVLKAALSAN